MSDDDMVECPDCGNSYKGERGLSTHQRMSDCEASDDCGDEEAAPACVYSSLEQQALDRDEVCRGCSSEQIEPHYLNSDVEKLSNIVSVCDDCLDEIDGLHPRTKRTVLGNL